MEQNIIRKAYRIAVAVVMAIGLAACDAHIEVPDTAVRPGHILCTDGTALPYSEYKRSGKQAIAVVFDTGQHGETEGNGYAVYLWDIAPAAFADSLGVEQGTSADMTAYDGNANTFALYNTQETASPMAEAVFDLWYYGQSAYVPSVAQMRLLYAARDVVGPIIGRCGVLVLDLHGGGGAADSQSVALLDEQRSHAGDAQDTGAPGAPDHNHQPLNV